MSSDDSRIDITDPQALREWARRLEASEEELRRAVDQVGSKVEDVREHLFGGFTNAGPTA